MIRVKNNKTIRNLSGKSFKTNKTRNLIAVVAIALTAVLFTTLFTMALGAVENIQRATMRQVGGDGHGLLKYITDEQFDRVKNHPLIKEIAYGRLLSDKVTNKEFLKRHAEFWYYDDVALKLGFIELAGGHKPMAENEVIADSKTLQLLGVPLKPGAPVTLNLDIRGSGEVVQRNFVLSGWWESDPVFNVGQIFASRAYVDAHIAELKNTYKENHVATGAISATIMFDSILDLEGKLHKVITESGYSFDENAANYMQGNVNWSYLSGNFGLDPSTIVVTASGLLLVTFTGYLIIYNIFQISVIRDIRFYGLLKTIGTTGKQIRRIIRRQAIILSVIGIPIGLLGGFFVGKSLVPLLVQTANANAFSDSTVVVSPSPWIFIGSALFALITVLISTSKPGRIAGGVSPVEAVRYSDRNVKKHGTLKKSISGAKMHRMALSNLGRNKKRTVLVVISLSLSLILLNTAFTLSRSIDMDKYISQFNDTDFLIAHAEYFQRPFFSGPENEVSESYIQAVQAQPGFEEGGRLYGNPLALTVDAANPGTANGDKAADAAGNFFSDVYGLEELPLHLLTQIDGELDAEKLNSGKYILEGVGLDDYGRPEMETANYKVGEKLILHNYMAPDKAGLTKELHTYEFTVIGHVGIKVTNTNRTYGTYTFYLPADVYKPLVEQPAVMSYVFNAADDQEQAMMGFLKDYTEIREPVMSYSSKLTTKQELSGMQNTVQMIGGTLSIIIGLIGILNFVNAILTSILTRRREFAMLQSIGMTQKQLRSMLIYEGLYYVIGTSLFSLLFGTVFSVAIVKPLCNMMWFLSYQFIIWPLLTVLPFLLILGLLIPLIAYSTANKQSIVERLREAE
ncbi:FtsX-like permease family protein [Paenibacillus macerans]|uniref:FtsX-like permease family protein n=1 Tax=Paenibacillus macerans TaxID=44252 RepID=A0A6N8EX62_PAEMA|nr:ABC transporter permease [Paenibacillus macerans]MUG23042.1 FtsX-like permease family protein [Paenibacillus macerans]UMV47112.1 ABC transporter permease [Paenibacillus macerans]